MLQLISFEVIQLNIIWQSRSLQIRLNIPKGILRCVYVINIYYLLDHSSTYFIFYFIFLFPGERPKKRERFSCQWPTYLCTIELIPLEIGCRSLEKTPVSSLVVCDVSFHLVLNNFI